MEIRRGILAAAMLAGLLSLNGCAPNTDALGTVATPETTIDPFAVDVQVPYVTNQPTSTPQTGGDADDSKYISISSDGKVTILKDSWDDLQYEGVDETGYYAQLRLGDSGVEVKNLQRRLKELGYYDGDESGEFDEATQAALMQFEANYYQKCYGVATVKLQSMLFSQNAVAAAGMAEATLDPAGSEDDEPDSTIAVPDSFRQLKFGDASEAVVSLQGRLKELGYLCGEVTGEYDYYTSCAVMRFEAAYGRKLTGIATELMQEYLFSEKAVAMNADRDQAGSSGQFLSMSKGDEGADVLLLQQRLVALGYSDATPNGKFNTYTANLLKVFQQNAGLDATGKADAATLKVLYGSSAPRGEAQ